MGFPKKSFSRWILYVPTETGYIIQFFNNKEAWEQAKEKLSAGTKVSSSS